MRQLALHNLDISDRILRPLAQKYIWWKTADEAMHMPAHVAAQVMNIGDFEDVQLLSTHLGDDGLRHVLCNAEIGQFDARSWAYWHYRLDLCDVDQVPPMPSRFIERKED